MQDDARTDSGLKGEEAHLQKKGPEMSRNVREIAIEILNRVDAEGCHAESLLDVSLSGTVIDDPRDRSLLTELVYGTLRMRGRLDWIIGEIYRGDAAGLETMVLNILRTGLYQVWHTDRIPHFAAVNEAVRIARNVSPAISRLVNAILRNAIRRKETIAWPEMDKNPAQSIAVLHSHPLWLVKRLIAKFGEEETIEICRANNAIPPTAIRVNSLVATREQALDSLAKEGFAALPASFSSDALLLASPSAGLRETAAYREGMIRIQDEASQLIAPIVAPRPGEQILDLCAGSGGKTLHLAALMDNRGKITAIDLHTERVQMLRKEAERLGATIVETIRGNAAALLETFHGIFDRVLLDAPCSGLGTLRRNPEIRWRLTEEDLGKCVKLQRLLLKNGAKCVKRGGRLIYSVCTLTPEENETIIRDFLKNHPNFKLTSPINIPPALIDTQGFFRTFPHRQGMDGFFSAVLLRVSW
jgi:16S rRNA (cytosine967-C5)-methyltransferase